MGKTVHAEAKGSSGLQLSQKILRKIKLDIRIEVLVRR